MKSVVFLIVAEEGRYVVARTTAGGETTVREAPRPAPADAAADQKALADVLAELDYRGEAACLGLPSNTVLSAEISCADLPRTRRRAAMVYRLEEQLPLDAELLTAAFLPEVEGRAMALAVETARVRAILDAVEAAGVRVASIGPVALLALAASRRPGSVPPHYAVLQGDAATDVLRLSDGMPVRWYTVSATVADWIRCLEVDLLTHPHEAGPVRVGCFGAPPGGPAVPSDFHDGSMVVERVSDEPIVALAARAARPAVSGQNPAWVDFRQGALAPQHAWGSLHGPLGVAMIAGLVFLAALAATFLTLGFRYGWVADTYEARQTEEYRKVFPAGDLPGSLPVRLRSEVARVEALSGAGEKPPVAPSALDGLRQVVTSLPPNVRVRVTDLRIEPTDLVIEGEVRTHGDAQLIMQALGRTDFQMEAPRSEVRAPDDVSFTLTGKRAAPLAAPARASGGGT